MLEARIRQALQPFIEIHNVVPQINKCPRRELGDYSSNLALLLSKKLSQNPLQLAQSVAQKINENDPSGDFSRVEAAPPGFINFTFSQEYLHREILKIPELDHFFGHSNLNQGQKVLLEFISANPTGPLHVGHGRWAVIGDVIAKLFSATGCSVEREYYVNNVGNQINKLVASVEAAKAGQPTPEGGYGGYYIQQLAEDAEIAGLKPGDSNLKPILVDKIIAQQKSVIGQLGISFNRWFFESELHQAGKIKAALERLQEKSATFEEGGAIWFKSQAMGDDKNRVLVREDGQPTYFAADIAYHLDKFERGYDRLIDIWGTDHHGYVGRLRAALQALGQPIERFEIIIGQLVTLYRGDEPIRMSKRTGDMVTLQEVIEEIGSDATRFFFAASDVNSHLDFDLELAKKKSNENPVYYVQYAHARICSILRKDPNALPADNLAEMAELTHPAERELIIQLISFPDLIAEAARLRHPHRLTEYGKELAICFHHFYEKCRVLGSRPRLTLVNASRIVIRNMLELLGIIAPESM